MSAPEQDIAPSPASTLDRVRAMVAAAASEGPFRAPAGQVVRAVHHGEPVLFTVTAPRDVIQQYHNLGRFYEEHEMRALQLIFGFGGTFVDIGANIGNHALYVAKFLRPRKVIVFEPNPAAVEILLSNLCLNGVEDVFDLSHLGYGVSDGASTSLGFNTPERNLGATTLVEEAGDVTCITGDSVLGAEKVSVIKIDVEGMEMRVLDGLRETIARCRPVVMIEVDNENREVFADWLKTHRYRIQWRFKRYKANQNFVVVPMPRPEGDTP
jgi:FkbM family methyltransferase